MSFPLLALELRKNRLAAAAVLAAFAVTLPVARLVSSVTGMETTRALEAALLVWMILGSPFAAALIASAAGAQTASRDARDAEALWPASPARRAAASVLAAALLAAAVSAVFVASAWVFGSLGWLDTTRNPVMNWGRPFWMDASLSPVFFAGLADALLSCWVLSYLIGHGVAGGLAGLLLTLASLTAAGLGMGLQLEHRHWGLSMGSVFAAHGVLTLVFKAAAVAMAAAWRERGTRLGARGAALLAGALLFGPVAGWAVAQAAFRDLSSRLKPADYPASHSLLSPLFGHAPASPAVLAAEGRALTVWSGSGALCLAGPDGVRRLIPPSRAGLFDALFADIRGGADAGRDADGTLWATRWDYGKLELWREKDGAMELARREPWTHSGALRRLGNELYLTYWRFDLKNSEMFYARVADVARAGLDAPATEGADATLAAAAGQARLAVPDCEPRGRCLKRGARTWTFPGRRLQPGAKAVPYALGRETVYLSAVDLKGEMWAMAARSDGRVEKLWALPRDPVVGLLTSFSILPDGTISSREPGRSLAWLGADGKAGRLDWGRLMDETLADQAPDLVRLGDGRAWLLWDTILQEVSLDGRELSRHPVPAHSGWRALAAGVIVYEEGRMTFVGWDGTVKRLAAPRS